MWCLLHLMGDLGLFKLQTHLEIICALTRIPRLGLGLKNKKNPSPTAGFILMFLPRMRLPLGSGFWKLI